MKTKKQKEDYNKRQREYNYKKSLKNNKPKIQCLICGKWYRQVGLHVFYTHKITAREYREKYGFDVKKGQLPEDLKKLKAEKAISCGGYKNLLKGAKYRFKKGSKKIGNYKRSAETIKRLKTTGKNKRKKEKNCITCNKELTGRQWLYCSKNCRQKDYKIKYNKHRANLFN